MSDREAIFARYHQSRDHGNLHVVKQVAAILPHGVQQGRQYLEVLPASLPPLSEVAWKAWLATADGQRDLQQRLRQQSRTARGFENGVPATPVERLFKEKAHIEQVFAPCGEDRTGGQAMRRQIEARLAVLHGNLTDYWTGLGRLCRRRVAQLWPLPVIVTLLFVLLIAAGVMHQIEKTVRPWLPSLTLLLLLAGVAVNLIRNRNDAHEHEKSSNAVVSASLRSYRQVKADKDGFEGRTCELARALLRTDDIEDRAWLARDLISAPDGVASLRAVARSLFLECQAVHDYEVLCFDLERMTTEGIESEAQFHYFHHDFGDRIRISRHWPRYLMLASMLALAAGATIGRLMGGMAYDMAGLEWQDLAALGIGLLASVAAVLFMGLRAARYDGWMRSRFPVEKVCAARGEDSPDDDETPPHGAPHEMESELQALDRRSVARSLARDERLRRL